MQKVAQGNQLVIDSHIGQVIRQSPWHHVWMSIARLEHPLFEGTQIEAAKLTRLQLHDGSGLVSNEEMHLVIHRHTGLATLSRRIDQPRQG